MFMRNVELLFCIYSLNWFRFIYFCLYTFTHKTRSKHLYSCVYTVQCDNKGKVSSWNYHIHQRHAIFDMRHILCVRLSLHQRFLPNPLTIDLWYRKSTWILNFISTFRSHFMWFRIFVGILFIADRVDQNELPLWAVLRWVNKYRSVEYM